MHYYAFVWMRKSFKDALQPRFSYHRWTDERDGVGKTAHDHLSSLRLKLTGRQREKGWADECFVFILTGRWRSPCCSTRPWLAPRDPWWWSGSSRGWRRSCRSSRSAQTERQVKISVALIRVFTGGMEEYRQAGRVGVLQKGLENDGEVILEETVAVEQLLKTFLCTETTWKSIRRQIFRSSNSPVLMFFLS